MIFRFLLLSDEADDFQLELKINADDTFADLQKVITDTVGYTNNEMASFFLCDDEWEKEQEISVIEMDTSSDEDSYVMSETVLGDLLEDERQKLMYVFDFLNERAFYMELREMIPGESLEKAICSKSKGTPPPQIIEVEETTIKAVTPLVDENFYGDQDFNLDELDAEGFDGLDAPTTNEDSI